MRIGVLALQGAVREHLRSLERCGVTGKPVKKKEELEDLAGLIIPGGESTTMGKLLVRYEMLGPLAVRAGEGMAIFGTCTGMILLAREIVGYPEQPRLGLMDINVDRNAYGAQVHSFEAGMEVPALGSEPLRAIFIRAPKITDVGPGVEILARWEDDIVLARQGRYLAAAFHPELTADARVHEYFLRECCGK